MYNKLKTTEELITIQVKVWNEIQSEAVANNNLHIAELATAQLIWIANLKHSIWNNKFDLEKQEFNKKMEELNNGK